MADIRIIPALGAINVTGSADFRGTGASTVLFVSGSGNVGVGTTNPISKFHVAGAVKATATTGHVFGTSTDTSRALSILNSGLAHGESYSMSLGYANSSNNQAEITYYLAATGSTSNRLSLGLYNSAETLNVVGTGRVGIGTTTPADVLHVYNGSDSAIRLQRAGSAAYAEWNYNGGVSYIGTTGNDDFYLMTVGAAKIAISTSGLITFTGYGSGTNTGTAAYTLTVDASGNIIESALAAIDGSGTANYIAKWSDSDSLTNSVIYDNGTNVGIGTTNPTQKLHIVGSTIITGDFQLTGANPRVDFNFNGTDALRFRDSTNAAERMRIDALGNVGIGLTTPSSRLDVYQSGSTVFNVGGSQGQLFSVTDSLSGSLMSVNDISGIPILEVFSDDRVIAGTFGANTLVVNGTTVGVGTAASAVGGAPGSGNGKLNIYTNSGSNSWAQQIRHDSTTGNGLFVRAGDSSTYYTAYFTGYDENNVHFVVNGAGSVGIGTNSPVTRLDVAGNIAITGSNPTYYATRGDGNYVPLIQLESSTDDVIVGFTSIDALRLYDDSGEVVRLDGTGKVGIGTTTPFSKLEIYQSASGTPLSLRTLGGNSGDVGLRFSIADSSVTTDAYYKGAIYLAGVGTTNALGDLVFAVNGAASSANVSLSDERMRITGTGSVGIGKTNPSYKLDVYGNAAFGTNSGGLRIDSFDANTGVISPTVSNGSVLITDDSRLQARGTEFLNGGGVIMKSLATYPALDVQVGTVRSLYIDGTGKVGIGNASPVQPLTVEGNISASGLIYAPNIGTGTDDSVVVLDSDGTLRTDEIDSRVWGTSLVDGSGTASYLPKWSDTNTLTDSIVYDNGTNVGINTSSPAARLEVFENGADANLRIHEDAGTHVARLHLRSGGNDTWIQNTVTEFTIRTETNLSSTPAISIGSTAGDVTFGYNVNVNGDLTVDGTVTAREFHTTFVSASIIYQSGSTQFGNSSDDTHIFTGNVGIGTSVPLAALDVTGTAYLRTTLFTDTIRPYTGDQLTLLNGGSNRLYINGNVGIGLTNPSAKLNIGGVAAPNIRFTSTSGPYSTIDSDTVGSVEISADAGNTGAASNINFKVDAANAMRIIANGNVGINTTTPGYKLDVNGDFRATSTITGTSLNVSNSSTNGTMVLAYADQFKRMWTTSMTFTWTGAGTYYFNLVFPNSGTFHYDLVAVTGRNGGYRNFGTLKDSSFIYWETDGDFAHRAEGDVSLTSTYAGGMYFNNTPTSFLSDSTTGTAQNGTSTWDYYIVRYAIYFPDNTTGNDGFFNVHLTTYGGGSSAPMFISA